jgi:hypothetical protein
MADGYQNWCRACQNERSVKFYYEKQKPARASNRKPVEVAPDPYECECCEMRFKTLRELYMHQWHEDHFGPIFNYKKTYVPDATEHQQLRAAFEGE